MAEYTTVSWRDIPAQIIVRAGRKRARRELSKRFMVAVDKCAMVTGADETDAYLAEWRRSTPTPCEDDIEQIADQLAEKAEAEYTNERLRLLVDAGGFENHDE